MPVGQYQVHQVYTTPEKEDARTPNQERFDRMIDFNRQQLEQLCQLNKNMAAVSNVLFKLLEANHQVVKVAYDPSFANDSAKINPPTVKKAVDKPVKVK